MSVEVKDPLQLQGHILSQFIKRATGGLDLASVFLGRNCFPTVRVGECSHAGG